MGWYGVGVMLVERRDLDGAAAAFQHAHESGHPEVAPEAAFQLALVRHMQDRIPEVLVYLERAAKSSHDDIAPQAATMLGRFLFEDEPQAASAHWEMAVASGHHDAAPEAARYLAELRDRQGDRAGALRAYRQAIDSGHPEHAPWAMFDLACLLGREGDGTAAVQMLRQARDTGHSEVIKEADAILLDEEATPPYDSAVDAARAAAADRPDDLPAQLAAAEAEFADARRTLMNILY
jgi:tetratricopeptide (TPR) repeat protein